MTVVNGGRVTTQECGDSPVFRWMAHDPSSPPKFLVPETGHQKRVPKLRTPDTRNWYQNHGVSNFVGSLRRPKRHRSSIKM